MKNESPINSLSHRNFVQGFAQTKVDVEAFIQSAAKLEREDLGEGLVSKTYLSENGVSRNAWVDQEGKAVPRIWGTAYIYVVPGPKGFFCTPSNPSAASDLNFGLEKEISYQ